MKPCRVLGPLELRHCSFPGFGAVPLPHLFQARCHQQTWPRQPQPRSAAALPPGNPGAASPGAGLRDAGGVGGGGVRGGVGSRAERWRPSRGGAAAWGSRGVPARRAHARCSGFQALRVRSRGRGGRRRPGSPSRPGGLSSAAGVEGDQRGLRPQRSTPVPAAAPLEPSLRGRPPPQLRGPGRRTGRRGLSPVPMEFRWWLESERKPSEWAPSVFSDALVDVKGRSEAVLTPRRVYCAPGRHWFRKTGSRRRKGQRARAWSV